MEEHEEESVNDGADQQPQLEVDERLSEAMTELASRVRQDAKITDLFGVDDSFVDNVINKAYVLYKAVQYEQAQVLLEGACALDPKRSYPRLLRGDVYLRQGELDKARVQFERAHELDVEDLMTTAKLGEVYLRTGARNRALELLQQVLDEAEQDAPYAKRAKALLDSVESPRHEAAGQ